MKLARLTGYLGLALTLTAIAASAQTMAIVNGASFQPNGPLAPGSFASMFGRNLCSQTAAADWVAPGQLPTNVAGCSVTVNGMPAMMHYVSPGQVNFIVPEGVGTGSAQVSVHNGANGIQGTMTVRGGGPGVFALSGIGTGQGAVLHSSLWRSGPFSVTTNGQPTHLSIYMTGLDLSVPPVVKVGGIPVEVTWHGKAPGFAGLQQVNIKLPSTMAGIGMAPMTVTSAGETSNVTYMNLLPSTGMMQGMPGWNSGMMVEENARRGHEMSDLAYNPSNNTALVTDEEDDALRVISMNSFETLHTITLPDGSEAHAVAVNTEGTMAAVALSRNASVALINLSQPTDITIVGTVAYPSRLAFAGKNLLVTNTGSGTVTVIDTESRSVIRTVTVGFAPTGIAADSARAVVSNMQAGSLSMINLGNYSVNHVDLPQGTRPHGVAMDSGLDKAVITTPMSNGFLILNLTSNQFRRVETGMWNGMGPGAVAIHNSRAYIANQMTASVTVVDLTTDAVVSSFPVDPGPRALAVDRTRNRLLVLSQGTGVMSAIDLSNFAVIGRANAASGGRDGRWTLPLVSAVTPNSAKRGTTFAMTIIGANLKEVDEVEFHVMGSATGMGSGGMGSGGMGGGNMGGGGMSGGSMGNHDATISTSNLQVNADGTQLTVNVTVSPDARPGTRVVSLETGNREVMGGPMFNAVFTVTP